MECQGRGEAQGVADVPPPQKKKLPFYLFVKLFRLGLPKKPFRYTKYRLSKSICLTTKLSGNVVKNIFKLRPALKICVQCTLAVYVVERKIPFSGSC
jgi:hypothetical protein